MIRTLITIFIFAFSLSSYSVEADTVLCNSQTRSEFGSLENIKVSRAISFREMINTIIMHDIKEKMYAAGMTEKYSGPDEAHIPWLIKVLSQAPGYDKEVQCLWGKYEQGDVLHEFNFEYGDHSGDGYILLRDSKPIAYFYWRVFIS